MTSTQISKAIVKKIISSYAMGLTHAEVAMKCGVSASSVGNVLKRAGIPSRSNNSYRQVSENVERKIVDAYLDGDSLKSVGVNYGISATTVRNILHRNGFHARSRDIPEKEKRKIVSRYKSGIPSTTLAVEFKRHKSTICQILRSAGVETRGSEKWEFDESFFMARNEISAYWMGFLMADGCLQNQGGESWRLTLCLKRTDYDHLKLFCAHAGVPEDAISSFVLNETWREHPSSQAKVVLSSVHFSGWLRPWGIVPRKTYCFVEPTISNQLYAPYLRGWFDGDGCIYKCKNSRSFSATLVCHKEEAADWYVKALVAAGYEGRAHKYWQKTKNGGYYKVVIGRKSDIAHLVHILQSSKEPCLKRKWQSVIEAIDK